MIRSRIYSVLLILLIGCGKESKEEIQWTEAQKYEFQSGCELNFLPGSSLDVDGYCRCSLSLCEVDSYNPDLSIHGRCLRFGADPSGYQHCLDIMNRKN